MSVRATTSHSAIIWVNLGYGCKKILPMRALLLSILVFLSSATYSADCSIDVFGNANKYPKVYLENNQAKGILVDMMRYIGKEVDCDFHFRLMPWKRAYLNMTNGKGLIIGLSKTSEREKIISYSDPMFNDEVLVVSHKDSHLNYKNIEDLNGLRLAYSRGASYGDAFNKATLLEYFIPQPDNGNITTRLKMVAYQRAGAALVGPGITSIEHAIEKDDFLKKNRNKLVIQSIPFKQDPNFIGYSKGLFPDYFMERLNKAITKGIESGRFQGIEKNYLN
jgi:ABC-type amino acid transport substrate-binding protein